MTKGTRGRPRQYDPDLALSAALAEFRRRGYSATSLDHLSEATHMARPSLYAAFGSKRDIYFNALGNYVRDWADKRRAALFDEPKLERALNAYFDALIAIYSEGGDEPLGCPVLSVIPGEAASDPEIRAELAAAIARTDAQFRLRLQQAREAGEISASADIDALADLLSAIQHSLALRARAGADRATLERIARSSVTALTSG